MSAAEALYVDPNEPIPEDWLEQLRGEMQLISGLHELVEAHDTRCPVRLCTGYVRTEPSLRLGLLCGHGHTGPEMFDAVLAESQADDDERDREAEAWFREHAPRFLDLDGEDLRADHLRAQLRAAHNASRGVAEVNLDSVAEGLAPRWPSTIPELEFYGVVIVLADAGIGKSLLAIGSAIEAASKGWRVAYLNAELDEPELKKRVLAYATSDPAGRSLVQAVRVVRWLSAGEDSKRRDFGGMAAETVQSGKRLLVVLDSINSLAEFAADPTKPGSDLAETSALYRWVTQVRKNTEGDVAFLVVSETNGLGGVKGRKGAFSADVVLKLEDSGDGQVEVIALKSRSSRKGSYGVFERDWKTGRFVK